VFDLGNSQCREKRVNDPPFWLAMGCEVTPRVVTYDLEVVYGNVTLRVVCGRVYIVMCDLKSRMWQGVYCRCSCIELNRIESN
jgi:hypothetical protein